MANNFNEIMDELNQLLKAGADSDPAHTGGGADVVNKEKGEVGSSTQALPAEATKGDVEHEDAMAMVRGDVAFHKEKAYPDRQRDAGAELAGESPEKKAAYRAMKLLNNIDFLLEGNMQKSASQSSIYDTLDKMSLQKAASFEAGKKAAQEWVSYLNKQAEEHGNAVEYQGDLQEQATGTLLDKTDPHMVSDGKSPEASPASSGDRKASPLTKGKDQAEEELEAQAEFLMVKAKLYDDLMKAASAQDESALLIAKSNIVDFLNQFNGV